MYAKEVLLKAAAVSGLSTLARIATGSQLRILCYHGLWVMPGRPYGECLFMPPQQFEARMARLKRSGSPVLSLGEAVARLEANDLPPAAVVITIDDGWVSTHTNMLPVLERYELPATLYATTWYSARDLPVVNVVVDHLLKSTGCRIFDRAATVRMIESLPESERLDALRTLGRDLGVDETWLESRQFHLMRPDELADARARGLDIQLHTHRHIDVHAQIGRLGVEIDDNRAFLADAIGAGEAFDHFCYPGGTFHGLAPALLAQNGVRSATLVDEGINAPGTSPYVLRRFLDGPGIATATFDAYLSGTLHYLSMLRIAAHSPRLEVPKKAASAIGMMICTI